jgi:hypothetical protein
MAGVYSSAAQGIESGFGMGLKAQAEQEAVRRTNLLEQHQTIQDQIAQQTAARQQAHQDFTDAATRDANQRTQADWGLKVATGQAEDIANRAAMVTAGGGEIPPEWSQQYESALAQARTWRQNGIDLAARLGNNVLPIGQLSGADLAHMKAATTVMKPEEWAKVPQAIEDANTGLSQNDMPLVFKALNVLMTSELKRGIGQPSAHGGNIVSKQIINAVPAAAPNGTVTSAQPMNAVGGAPTPSPGGTVGPMPNGPTSNPDLVLPIIRVTTDQVGPDGQQLYYDAPMTQDGSVDGKIVPLSIRDTIERMKNMQQADTAFAHPEIAPKLAAGEAAEGPAISKQIDTLRYVANAKAAGLKMDTTTLKLEAIHRYAVANGLTDMDAAAQMQKVGLLPGGPRQLNPWQEADYKSRIALREAQSNKIWATPPKGAPANVDFTKTGDDFLSQLPPQDQAVVKAISNGTEKLENVSIRNDRREYFGAALAQYDKTYSQQDYPSIQAVKKDFTSGVAARNVTAINTAIGHAGALSQLFTAENNHDTTAINRLVNTVSNQLGDPSINNVEIATTALGDELMRVFRQVGASEVEAKQWQAKFGPNLSPAQQQGALATATDLLASRIEALNDQYKRGTKSKTGFPDMLSPKSRTVLDMLAPGRLPPEAAPTPTAPAPAAAPAPAGGPVAAGVARTGTPHEGAISPAEQRSRDTDAAQILRAEISRDTNLLQDYQGAAANFKPEDKSPPAVAAREQVARKQSDIASLNRELSKLPGGGTPRGPVAAAVAPAPAAPVAAPAAPVASADDALINKWLKK